jgi:hypothetical protein
MPHDDSMFAATSQLFIGASIFFGFSNLLPIQHRGAMLDGMRLWVLLFSSEKRQRMISIVVLAADFKQGKLLDSLDSYPIEKWSSVNDGTAQYVIANWVAYHKAADNESAGRHLEICLASSSAVDVKFRSCLMLEAARFQIIRRKRSDIAREWLSLINSNKPDFDRLWTEVLIFQHEDQFETAIGKVAEARACLAQLPQGAVRERRWQALDDLEQTLRQQGQESRS